MSAIVCCPLSEADDCATVYNVDTRRARTEHACVECRVPITRGEQHVYTTMLFDGAWSSYRMCLLCTEIGDHFSCGRGRILETLWSDLEENFFPDMKCGGQCMTGLSPAAKRKLIDARMEWYFDQGEIDDSAWEDWPKNKDVQRTHYEKPVVEEQVPYYETPEYYWPRQFELEAQMRAYEEEQAKAKEKEEAPP